MYTCTHKLVLSRVRVDKTAGCELYLINMVVQLLVENALHLGVRVRRREGVRGG